MRREYLYDRESLPGTAGSLWLAGRERPPLPALSGDAEADVIVVGGGLTGILAAWRLAASGAQVIVLEGRRLCSDVSGHTTAKATAQHGLLTESLPEQARGPWLAENVRALDRLERLADIAGDSAGFERTRSVLYTTRADGEEGLRRELELYRSLGLSCGVVETGQPPGVSYAIGLQQQAVIDPVGLCDALVDSAPPNLRFFEGSMVRSVNEKGDRVHATTDGGKASADWLVVATNMPFFDTLMYVARLFQRMTYAVEIETAQAPPTGMWYSEDLPSISWRPVRLAEPKHLVVSGLQHKSGEGGDERRHYHELVAACRDLLGEFDVLRHWSTQDPYTPDGLPLVGRMIGRDRCYMASGYSGWGMTSSEVAADVLSALLGGGDHPLADLVSPLRVGTTGLVTLAVENADVVAKAFSQEVVPNGEPADVPPGGGMAMRFGGEHVALARDADGTLHASDAHCAHMRCGVSFNEAEGTWDCPCHGSRYLGDGTWLHGPAKRGLEPAKIEES